jgi:hypothetical protein
MFIEAIKRSMKTDHNIVDICTGHNHLPPVSWHTSLELPDDRIPDLVGWQLSLQYPLPIKPHETSTVRERRKIKSGEQGAKPLDYFGKYGAPGTIRTCDRLVRSDYN